MWRFSTKDNEYIIDNDSIIGTTLNPKDGIKELKFLQNLYARRADDFIPYTNIYGAPTSESAFLISISGLITNKQEFLSGEDIRGTNTMKSY